MEREGYSGGLNAESFAWFAVGALLGATAAVLLAPEKGSDTRQRLAGRMKTGGQNLFDSSHEVIAKGRELFEQGREIAQEAAEMFDRGRRMAEANSDRRLEPKRSFERGF
jgi:gas vesicle protein